MEEKLSFMCDVLQGERCIVEMQWETDWSTTSSFKDVFMSIAPEKVRDSPVEIKLGSKQPNKNPGNWVSVRLDQPLKLISLQAGNFLRFTLPAEGILHKFLRFSQNRLKTLNDKF